ncbi:MAG: N-acetylmuramoyl-L-alanine amidase [Candidatus Xiphinematobacter sp.]|nr:MAG: N-acetylmuramoyl-L-alanine amidase [Candidatus Xiphinematobacter sp.]
MKENHLHQFGKQPLRSWKLGKPIILVLGVAALLTGNASSSFKQSIPSAPSLVVLSEQKRKELFLAIRKGGQAGIPSLPIAPSAAATQPCSNSRKENIFAASWPSDPPDRALIAQPIFPRKPPSPQVRSRLASDKGSPSNTVVRTVHAVKSVPRRKPVIARQSVKHPRRAYRFLTPAVRQAIDQAPVRRGRWKYIIVHNSGTRRGNARAFDAYHRRVRRMKNGLAYHFVVGNGRLSRDGEIEVGNRWRRQINGGHVASDRLNNIAIGICLVGDFNRHTPTPKQLAAFEELTSCLQARVGRSKRRRVMVRGHMEVNSRPTDCPGRRFSLHWLHGRFPGG